MSMSRYPPVYQPPATRFLAMTPWDELEHSLHGMNRHMREMDQQFNSVFNQFLQLTPADGKFSNRLCSIFILNHWLF